MFSFSRGTVAFGPKGLLLALAVIFSSFTFSQAQINGVNSTGTFGVQVIQGRIHFPSGHKSATRPVVKLRGDASNELTTVANSDGSFSFTGLRADSYVITVIGGDEYENASETVSIGSAGSVPAQGNAIDYVTSTIYQVQIYLQPKRSKALHNATSATTAIPDNVPPSARKLFGTAVEAARLGDHQKAVEQFQVAISQASDFRLAYNELGVEYLKLGQADKAAESFSKAIKIGPADFLTHLNYGVALLNVKKFAEAEQQLRLSLKQNTASPIAHYYLGLALLNQHAFEAAEGEFAVSIKESNDRIPQAHKYLGGIYWRNKQYTHAADELTKYLAQEPQASDAAQIRETIQDLRSKK